MSSGRVGSFTQWILRSDLCSCETAGLSTFVTPAPAVSGGEDVSASDEPELELDAETFPVERYKAVAEIGRGNAGLVYLCRDRLMGQYVAIKCLRSVTDSQLVSFQNEAKVLSQLNHPGIVTVLNFGTTASGAPYMVLEHVKGVTLDCLIEEHGVMPVDLCVKMFARMAEALSYSHSKGVLHRDIKSSNILVVDGDELDVRLIDFGVAAIKHATQEVLEYQSKSIVGTPGYMPADQALGLPYDQRSEIYGLGCVIFESLTGRLPFVGDSALFTIAMHAMDRAPRLQDVRADLEFPEDLERVVAKCLEKEPAARFQTMQELQEALVAIDIAGGVVYEVEKKDFSGKGRILIKYSLVLVALLVTVGAVMGAKKWYDDEISREDRMARKKFAEKGLRKAIDDLPRLFQYSPEKQVYIAQDGVNDDHLVALSRSKKGQIQGLNLEKTDQQFDNRTITARGWKAIGRMDLRKLDLSLTQVQDEDLQYLAPLRHLEMLNLTKTAITDQGIDNIKNLPSLKVLILTSTKITDRACQTTAAMKSIESVLMLECNVTDAGLKQLSCNPGIRQLNLGGTSVSDNGLKYLARMPRLERVLLERTKVTPQGLKQLAGLKLKELSIGSLGTIDEEMMRYIVKTWPALETVEMGENGLTKNTIKILSTLPNLQEVSLNANELTDADVEVLVQNPNLTFIALSHNNLTDKTAERICKLPKIDFIDLNHCPLSRKGIEMLEKRAVRYTAYPPMGKPRREGDSSL